MEAKLNGYCWPFWLIRYFRQLDILQLLLLVPDSSPEGIVLAVATKCHCSHSLKTHTIKQIKLALGKTLYYSWVGLGVEASRVTSSCHQSSTDNAPSRACSCRSLQEHISCDATLRKDHSCWRNIRTGDTKWWAKRLTCNTRNLRWHTSGSVKSSSSHPLSIVTNCKNISSLFQRKGNQVSWKHQPSPSC